MDGETVSRPYPHTFNAREASAAALGVVCAEQGQTVYGADGERLGKVSHVLAVADEDVFDGIVIGEHLVGDEHRFADADDGDAIYERGVDRALKRAACEQLPKLSTPPAVIRDDPC